MANPTTNYGFVLPTSSDLVTDLPADFDVALQGVDTRLKALQPGTTAGDLVYSSATANTNTRLALGTAGQVLQVNSGATAPEWATASSGALTLINRTSFSDVATTTTSFDDVFSSTYTQYIVRIETLFAATGTDDLLIQMRYAGPTTETGAYYGATNSSAYNTSALTYVGTNGASALTLVPNIGSTTERGAGQINFSRVGNTSEASSMYGQYTTASSSLATFNGGTAYVARTYTGFILSSSSSNITGTVSVYGMAKS